MINRAHRFHGYNALRHVYGRGQTVRGPMFAVKYLPNPKRGSYRAAVVVSRKVHKSAVVRARIRRRLYEIIRTNASGFNGLYDIAIVVFSEAVATIPAAKLEEQVLKLLKQAQIIK